MRRGDGQTRFSSSGICLGRLLELGPKTEDLGKKWGENGHEEGSGPKETIAVVSSIGRIKILAKSIL